MGEHMFHVQQIHITQRDTHLRTELRLYREKRNVLSVYNRLVKSRIQSPQVTLNKANCERFECVLHCYEVLALH